MHQLSYGTVSKSLCQLLMPKNLLTSLLRTFSTYIAYPIPLSLIEVPNLLPDSGSTFATPFILSPT
jgi:hypothetical protein